MIIYTDMVGDMFHYGHSEYLKRIHGLKKEYIDLHKIDLIFTPDNRTDEEMERMMKEPFEMGIVRKIPYTHEISTTDIIKRIKDRDDL